MNNYCKISYPFFSDLPAIVGKNFVKFTGNSVLILTHDFSVNVARSSVQSIDFIYVLLSLLWNLQNTKKPEFCRFYWKIGGIYRKSVDWNEHLVKSTIKSNCRST